MRFKRFGCSLGFFLLLGLILYILLEVGNNNPAVFWWIMAALALVVAGAAIWVRRSGGKPEKQEEAKPEEEPEAPLVILSSEEAAAAVQGEAKPAAEPVISEPEPEPEPLREETPPAREEPLPEDDGSHMSAGSYVVGTDIPAGKYNFRALRGSGKLRLLSPDGTERFSALLGTRERTESAEYRNLICKDGETLTLDGSLIATVQKSKMLVVD